MTLRVAVQMDPIENLVIAGDSTFALMLEAESRGHELFSYQTKTLALEGSNLWARGHHVRVRDEKGSHFTASPEKRVSLGEFDVVLMRQDPPIDMNYITATHLLEHIHPRTLVVNDPREVRNAPEKLYILKFRDLMPPTLITRDARELVAFRKAHSHIILKPLYGNGGAGVFRVKLDDENFGALMEMFTQFYREPVIVQRYIPEVRKGDKRIILVDGEFAGAINRVPAQGEARSNMHVGGRPEATELSAREKAICAAIGPELKRRGLIFTGIDVIGEYMTEINVTCPTGIHEVRRFGDHDIAALVWDAIERKRK